MSDDGLSVRGKKLQLTDGLSAFPPGCGITGFWPKKTKKITIAGMAFGGMLAGK